MHEVFDLFQGCGLTRFRQTARGALAAKPVGKGLCGLVSSVLMLALAATVGHQLPSAATFFSDTTQTQRSGLGESRALGSFEHDTR